MTASNLGMDTALLTNTHFVCVLAKGAGTTPAHQAAV